MARGGRGAEGEAEMGRKSLAEGQEEEEEEGQEQQREQGSSITAGASVVLPERRGRLSINPSVRCFICPLIRVSAGPFVHQSECSLVHLSISPSVRESVPHPGLAPGAAELGGTHQAGPASFMHHLNLIKDAVIDKSPMDTCPL